MKLKFLFTAMFAIVVFCFTQDVSWSAEPKKTKKKRDERPNVLLIVCDDLNDSVEGFGGHPQAKTPHLDRFAKTAVRFQHAYTNAPICAPSRSSFLTGIYPSSSGNYQFHKWFEVPVLSNSKTLMAHFKSNRYHTAGTGKLMHHHRRSEYNEFGNMSDYGPHAFDGEKIVAHPSVPKAFQKMGTLDGSLGPLSDVPFGGKNRKGWIFGTWKKPNQPWLYETDENRDRTPDEKNAKWAADFLRDYSSRKKNRPFFLGVGFIRPHTPMVAPKRFFEMFPIETVQPAKLFVGDKSDTYFKDGTRGSDSFKALKEGYGSVEAGLKAYTQAYLACVAAVDECVGEVLDALEESGHAENTIVIVTSDHGFNLGEKEYVYKNSLWEESARVPLIVRAPGISKAGTNADHPVSLIDLYPTLVDLCGLNGETKKNEKGHSLDGHSIRPFLENPENGKWDGPDGALTVVLGGWTPNSKHHWSYRTSKWRYIRYNDGNEELYDHDNDPYEWKNLANSAVHQSVKQSLYDQLKKVRGPVSPGATPVKLTPAKKWDWFAAIDANKDGKATETEWLTWSKEADEKKKIPFDETKRKNAFKYFDKNKDGHLSKSELNEVESGNKSSKATK